MALRRILLVALVLAAASQLPGCGATAEQRMADRTAAAHADLYSPAMDARIAEARR